MVSVGKLTLFGFSGSSTTNRIRIALAVKGIPYQFQSVNIGQGEQKTESYRDERNRLAQIPLLQVDNDDTKKPCFLRQSIGILEYLEEAYLDAPKLLPSEPLKRAQVREVVEIVNSYIQPMQNKLTVEMIAEMDPKFKEWLHIALSAHLEGTKHGHNEEPNFRPHFWIRKGFEAIEGLIDEGGDDNDGSSSTPVYCFGNQVTLADCALVPQVIGAKKYGVNLEPYPKIRRVYDNVVAMDAVRKGLTDVLGTV